MLGGVAAATSPIIPELPIIRARGEGEQRATFFDLVYVFAVTQLSHHLVADISWSGAAETAFMLVALYWAWNYTTPRLRDLRSGASGARLFPRRGGEAARRWHRITCSSNPAAWEVEPRCMIGVRSRKAAQVDGIRDDARPGYSPGCP
jgi:hypothetical protein